MQNLNQHIKNIILESADIKKIMAENDNIISSINKAASIMIQTFQNNGKVMLAGNGGSAADAQHIAAEMSGKFYIDREPLDAEALHVNSSFITAVSNDYSYEEVYVRALKAKAKHNDVFIAISTSGNSKNIIKAIDYATSNNIFTIGLTGKSGGKMKDKCNININVPSDDTPRIQEMHILVGHILCEIIENKLFNNDNK